MMERISEIIDLVLVWLGLAPGPAADADPDELDEPTISRTTEDPTGSIIPTATISSTIRQRRIRRKVY